MLQVMWVPKSEKGRRVARALRENGHDVRDSDIMGEYVGNLQQRWHLSHEDLRTIAYILAPEWAAGSEEDAYRSSQWLEDAGRAEEARRVLYEWLY